ncbi:phage virion morphogenesis protein [Marinomonas atlantica]|uniref:phage virion morphogenesis protein n=1 Tax=Marinomonas atlantica TaxID=1806668 RepID=UPI00082BDBB5|nr:phage virion morphogenesis protein [Marinomonas atlantica]
MATDSGLRAAWHGESALVAELKLLSLPRQRRKRALGQIGREVKKQARLNVRKQSSVRGQRFADRKKKRSKKGRMLSGFVRGGNIRHKASATGVTVGFKSDTMAKMAAAHQYGESQTVRAKPMSAARRREWGNDSATKVQAKRIQKLGYKHRKKRVSQRYIMESMTKLQALGLIYKLEGDQEGRQSWDTDLPAREFFPNDAQWVKQMTVEVIAKELSRG